MSAFDRVHRPTFDSDLGPLIFDVAASLDEATGPLAPCNGDGVTKLADEGLSRVSHSEHGVNGVVLCTGRFFPETR